MTRKYNEPEMPERGWKDWFMGAGEETLEFEKSLKEESLLRHTGLLEKDMASLCNQIKSRASELTKYNVYLRDQLRKHGDWGWSEGKYPQPEYVQKAKEQFIMFYEREFTPIFELLTSTIEEYRKLSGGAGRYKNVIKAQQQCIDKTKSDGQKYIESFIDLEEKSIKARDKKIKEQENAPTTKSRYPSGFGFGGFKQNYVKEKPKPKPIPKPKSSPKMPKPKKTIKKTTQASPTLVPSQYFRDQVKKYLKKDMTTPVATKAEIKKAWHKLALQLHPDKLTGLSKSEQDEAVEIFNTITEEKDVLCGTVKIAVEDPTWKKAGKGKKTKKTKKGKKSKKGKKGK